MEGALILKADWYPVLMDILNCIGTDYNSCCNKKCKQEEIVAQLKDVLEFSYIRSQKQCWNCKNYDGLCCLKNEIGMHRQVWRYFSCDKYFELKNI